MSSLKLVLLGFLRHTLTLLGMWLVAKGYLTAEAKDAWVGKAVEEATGAIMIGGSYLWSFVDKQQVIGWLRKALHMTPQNEKVAAKKISALVTSPGTTPVPPAALLLFALVFAVSCSSGFLPIGPTGECKSPEPCPTIYRSAEKARTALTAFQTLRYHAAEAVAKAYVQGRVSKEDASRFNGIDNRFRTAWANASDLVQLWLVSKEAPGRLQQMMAEVEDVASELDVAARKAE